MAKPKPTGTKTSPVKLSTIIDITPYLIDSATLYTFTEGSIDSYGKAAQTWSKSTISCKVSYYYKGKEKILPMGFEEEETYLILAEPNALAERAIIGFKSEYYKIITIQQPIVDNVIVYDRGVMKKMVSPPQGLPS